VIFKVSGDQKQTMVMLVTLWPDKITIIEEYITNIICTSVRNHLD